MKKSMNDYVNIYKTQVEKYDIQIAYKLLVKYVMNLKAYFSKEHADKYIFGNVSPGYMDYTYFPFFNDFLRSKKLRFGIVLNHQKMRFELWLMGQNSEIQNEYWDILKTTKWNQLRTTMPKYSVLEDILVETPDFDDLEKLSKKIEKAAIYAAKEILEYIPK